MVFPAELFPDPALPSRTILSSDVDTVNQIKISVIKQSFETACKNNCTTVHVKITVTVESALTF